MNIALNAAKKTFTWSVVVTTILWSMGIAALMPLVANAAECSDVRVGDRFKIPGNPAVYVLNKNMERMYFTNSVSYKSWYPDYSGIIEVPQSCIAGFPAPSAAPYGINFRPGTLVKVQIDPTVYVVKSNNELVKIDSEAAAAKLAGANWASKVYDINDAFWPNYRIVAGTNNGTPVAGMIVKQASSADSYTVGNDGKLWKIDGSVPSYLAGYVTTVDSATFSSMEVGGNVLPSSLSSDPTQGAGGSSGPVVPGNPGSAGTNLSVSLSANTPASAIVPQGATHVPYLRVTLRAGSQSVNVTGMELQRVGLGDSDNFSKVWLATDMSGSVSNQQSVSSDDTVTLSPTITVPANGSVDVWVLADLATNAATDQQDGLRVTSVTTDGAAVTGLPVSGNIMSYSSFSIGQVTIDDRGADDDIKVGDTQQIIGEFELSYTSSNQRNGSFESIRLKMDGSTSPSDFANIGLFEAGTKISEAASVSGDYVTFSIMSDKKKIDDGKTRRFEVRADIASGEDANTVILTLKDNRDLYVKEIGSDFGARINNSLPASGSLKTYTIDAGQFTVSLDTTNPSNETYAKNMKDIVALIGRADLGQPVRVDGLAIKFHTDSNEDQGTSGTELTNINNDIERAELWVNDTRISTLTAATAVSSATNDNDIAADEYEYNFDSTFELRDNDLIKLVLDLESDARTNTYKFTFDSGDFDNAEYVRTTESVDAGNLSGTVTGNNVQISAASITFTRNDGYSSGETFVAGAQGVKLLGMLVDSGNSSAVRVRTLDFTSNLSASYLSSNYTRYTNCNLKVDGSTSPLSGKTADMTSSGALNFTGLSLEIPANSQKQVNLYCDIQSGASATSGWVITLDTTNSLVEDAEGDTITGYSAATSASLTISTGGTLVVTVDGDTADPNLIVAGQSTGVDLATWKFVAQNDGVYIKDLYIGNNSTTSAASTTESAADFLVNRYELVINGQSTVLQSKAPVSGKVHFELTGENRIFVPKDGTKRVTVRAVLNNINQAAQTGQQIKLALYAIEADSAGPGTELTSSNLTNISTTTDNTYYLDSAPTGNLLRVVKTAPTLATVALSDTVLKNAAMDIFKFSVTADSAGDLGWAQLIVTVSGNCNTQTTPLGCLSTSSMRLYDASNQVVPATFSTSSGILTVNLTTPKTVAAGSTETYRINTTLTGFDASDAMSLQIRDSVNGTFAANTASTAKSTATTESGPFVWSDYAGTDESTTDSQWFIGKDVNGLDTNILSLTFPS